MYHTQARLSTDGILSAFSSPSSCEVVKCYPHFIGLRTGGPESVRCPMPTQEARGRDRNPSSDQNSVYRQLRGKTVHIKAHSGGKQRPPTSPRSALGGLRARKKVLGKAREILTTSTQSSWGLELAWLPAVGPVKQPWAPWACLSQSVSIYPAGCCPGLSAGP